MAGQPEQQRLVAGARDLEEDPALLLEGDLAVVEAAGRRRPAGSPRSARRRGSPGACRLEVGRSWQHLDNTAASRPPGVLPSSHGQPPVPGCRRLHRPAVSRQPAGRGAGRRRPQHRTAARTWPGSSTCRRRRFPWPPTRRGPTTGCGSSCRERSCRSPVTRRSAPLGSWRPRGGSRWPRRRHRSRNRAAPDCSRCGCQSTTAGVSGIELTAGIALGRPSPRCRSRH